MPKTHAHMVELTEDALTNDATWRKDAKEAYGFYTGRGQWIDKTGRDLSADIEADGGRAAMTFNIIFDKINALQGTERINRSSVNIFPMEDGDGRVAEALTKIHKQIDYRSDGEYQQSKTFFNGLVTGRGWIGSDISTQKDRLGEVIYKAERPLLVFYDRGGDEYDQSDWDYVGRIRWYSESKAAALWPKYAKRFKELLEDKTHETSEESGGSPSGKIVDYDARKWCDAKTKRIRVIELEYREYERLYFMADNQTGTIRDIDEKAAKAVRDLSNRSERFRLIEYVQPVTRIAILTRLDLMSDEQRSTDHPLLKGEFSLMPYFAYEVEGEHFGVVENLKDPQRERNVRRSQIQNFLGRLPGIVIMDEGATVQSVEWLAANINKPGTIIVKKKGGAEAGREFRIESLGEIVQGFFELEQESKVDAKEISGVNDAYLGVGKSGESGTAINLRQKQGFVTTSTLFDNLRRTKKMLGRRNIGLIQDHYTTPRTMRIIGDKDPLMINQSGFADVTAGQYDAMVDEGENSPTFQLMQWEILKEYTSLYPDALPQEIVFDAAPLPASIKDKVKAWMAAQPQPVVPAGGGDPNGQAQEEIAQMLGGGL